MPLQSIVRRLIFALGVIAAVTLLGGLALYALGHGRWTLPESLYMAMISASTAGFNELPDLDRVAGARGVTVATILTGVGAFAYFQSVLTAMLVEGVVGHAWRRKS